MAASKTATPKAESPRLKQRYESELKGQLKDDLGVGNVMQVPRMIKIVINMGVGRATQQRSLLDGAVTDLTIITGQKPMVTKAKKSIASFKLREGNEIGAKVTLRGDRMWEFYDRLVSLAIPRIRDFRGMSPTQFDGHGNYTFGLTEQLVFPEIDYDNIDSVRGMDITIVTTAQTDEHGRALFARAGLPVPPRWAAGVNRMAKKALINKQQRTPKFKVRGYTRCRRCGRARSVYRDFGLCRICLRMMAHAGEVPGVTKSSW